MWLSFLTITHTRGLSSHFVICSVPSGWIDLRCLVCSCVPLWNLPGTDGDFQQHYCRILRSRSKPGGRPQKTKTPRGSVLLPVSSEKSQGRPVPLSPRPHICSHRNDSAIAISHAISALLANRAPNVPTARQQRLMPLGMKCRIQEPREDGLRPLTPELRPPRKILENE